MKLSKLEVLILGAVLAAAEGVQINITMSAQAHAVLTMAIVVLGGAGVQAISATAFLAALPAHLATIISSLLGGLLVLLGTISLSSAVHTLIAVVVVIATVLGVGPEPPAAAPASVIAKPGGGVTVPDRQFGHPHPSTVKAADQLQKTFATSSAARALPAGSPGRAAAAALGFPDPGGSFSFPMIGDHGGIENPTPQKAVAYAIAEILKTLSMPFAYSVGDWGYFGGDEGAWASQVYQAYQLLLLALLGVGGNHDDVMGGDPPYDLTRATLDAFMANLCARTPGIPPADPQMEFGRHTETQPYCDWTLTLDALTIIGVWSNVPSGGHLFDSQTAWLAAELEAAPADRPCMVCLHHPPYSIDAHHGGSATMGAALDGAFEAAKRCPDVVLSGHVHDYQRFTRTFWGKQIPYVVIGNSGYHNLHALAGDYSPGMSVAADVTCEYADASEYGFLLWTVAAGKLSAEYVGVSPGTAPDLSDTKVTRGKDTFTV